MLKRAGIPYTVIEKNAGVGGTWYETRYPGARVDTPSRGYTHIFGAHFPYSSPFCDWAENQRYFDWVADTFDLRDDIVFDTEVRALTWDEAIVDVGDRDRRARRADARLRSNAVVTAVGFLNRPKIPEIEGMAEFRGAVVAHRPLAGGLRPRGQAHRRRRHRLHGLPADPGARARGGARGRLPAHAAVAVRRARATCSPFPPEVAWLDRNLPYYTNFMRLRTLGTGKAFWRLTEIDPHFDDPHTVSPLNKTTRETSLAFLESKLGDTRSSWRR